MVRTLAGGLNGTIAAFADGTGTQAGFNSPTGVVVDASGNTYVADRHNHRVRKVTPGGGANIFFHVDGKHFEACFCIARNDQHVW